MGQHSTVLVVAAGVATFVVVVVSVVGLVLMSLPSPTVTQLVRRWRNRRAGGPGR